MAFPASTVTAEQAWNGIRDRAVRLKSQVQTIRDSSAAGDTGRTSYIGLQRSLDRAVSTWNAFASVPGLQAYARDQIDDATLDLAAEFVAMRDAAIALRNWIFANMPRDAGTGAVLLHTVGQDGAQIELTVTAAQTAGFRSAADVFLLTIN